MIIAVSGLNNTDNPAPGIPVAKSLIEAGHKVIGLSYDPNEPGNFMPEISATFLMPFPSQGIEELLSRLKYIKEKTDIEAIIPNLDAELNLYIKYKKDIESLGIKLLLPNEENFELRNKDKLAKLSKDLKITYPTTYECNSIQDLNRVFEKEKFPIMIKGKYYKAYKAYSKEQAYEYFYKIANEWGYPILAQKVVQGEEINYVGVGDGKGNLIGGVGIKKLTTTDIGKIWTGITIDNQKLIETAKTFVKNSKWEGPFELECMIDSEELFMIEINPRFPAWVYFATDIGVNLPKLVIDSMNHKAKVNLEYPKNKMYIRYVNELTIDYTEYLDILMKKERI